MTKKDQKLRPLPGMRAPKGQEKRFNLRIDMPHVDLIERPADASRPAIVEPDSASETVLSQTVVPETTVTSETILPQTTVPPGTIVPETTVVREEPRPSSETTVVRETTVLPEKTVVTEMRVHPLLNVDPREGFLQISNTFVDSLLPQLDAYEQLVLFRLYRLSYGHQRDTCVVSHKKLAETLRLAKSTIERTMASLRRRGLVEPLTPIFGGKHDARGNHYRIVLPPGTLLRETTVPRKKTVIPQTTVVRETSMKDLKEKSDMSVYEIRTIAARLFEAHRGETGFDHDRLRQLVSDALIGQGRTQDGDAIEEAIRGMAV